MISKTRQKRKVRVVVFGVFDGLHPGHRYFLHTASRYGHELIVVLTPDFRVQKEKGRRPRFSQQERIAALATLRCVDRVVLGDFGNRWHIVERLRPDIICVGHDQRTDYPAFQRQLARLQRQPRLIVLPALRREQYASSKRTFRRGRGWECTTRGEYPLNQRSCYIDGTARKACF